MAASVEGGGRSPGESWDAAGGGRPLLAGGDEEPVGGEGAGAKPGGGPRVARPAGAERSGEPVAAASVDGGGRSGPPGVKAAGSWPGDGPSAGEEPDAGETPADPVEEKTGDSPKGTETMLGKSSKKSKAARVGGEETSENGKEDSSKTTWRDMMMRLE